MITEYLQSEIARLKSEIDEEETRYFDGIKDNQIVLELIEIRQNIKKLRHELDQNIEMLSLT
jgi:hypothetical protein